MPALFRTSERSNLRFDPQARAVSWLLVDAGGVQTASGKAEESADTGVVSVGSSNAAGRRLGVARAARQS
jgi:hypothetical protein